jgi:hypothetical protein
MAQRLRRFGARPAAILAVSVLLAIGTGACGQDAAVTELTGPQAYGGRYAGSTATGDSEQGAAFARWVMDQDPQRRYLAGAVVRGDQTLGVRVRPNITKGELQELLVSLAQGMARAYPDRPLKVIAFYQSGDKLAEATFDPRTGRVSVG